jgi:hypothetical protein
MSREDVRLFYAAADDADEAAAAAEDPAYALVGRRRLNR